MIPYVILGLLIIIVLLVSNYNKNENMKIKNNEEIKENQVEIEIPQYPIYPTKKTELQRRMFDSLTYDYIDDKSKAVNLKLMCF